MVRLRAGEDAGLEYIKMYFNSNMVRLRVKNLKCAETEITEFQFQYGAIKSCSKSNCIKQNRTFQFQYGAIKSAKILPM